MNIFKDAFWILKPALGEVDCFLKTPKEDKSIQFIKRVVGRPGDRVQFLEGVFHIVLRSRFPTRIEDLPI